MTSLHVVDEVSCNQHFAVLPFCNKIKNVVTYLRRHVATSRTQPQATILATIVCNYGKIG